MKANAPEKIYLQQYDENTLICLNKWNISDEWTNKPFNEKIATNIEYVHKDTFIKKAEEFIYSALNNGIMGTANIEDFMRLFKKYLKGE